MKPKTQQAEFLDTAHAAAFIGISESYLHKMRSGFVADPGPPVVRIGRKCLYSVAALRDYMNTRADGGAS